MWPLVAHLHPPFFSFLPFFLSSISTNPFFYFLPTPPPKKYFPISKTWPKVSYGLKMATFGGVCFLDFFYLGTRNTISDTPKMPILGVLGVSEMALPCIFPCKLTLRFSQERVLKLKSWRKQTSLKIQFYSNNCLKQDKNPKKLHMTRSIDHTRFRFQNYNFFNFQIRF